MKLNRILKYAAVSALVVSTGVMTMGCTDNFENLNTDPYEVDPDELPFSAQFKEPFSYGEFYQFNLSSCIRQQNSLTAQFVSFSLANLANIFYPPPIFTIINLCLL